MYLLRKAHVRDYDRVSKTGALEHIRAHEDSRVRSYARKIVGSRDSYDLHQIRRDRFGHLPHWNKLDDRTRQAIVDAEDEKARSHKEFEEWVGKHGSKKDKKKDAEKVDRSGWEQQLMFKGRPNALWLLRKSKHDVSIEARDGHGRWSKTVDRPMRQVFTMEEARAEALKLRGKPIENLQNHVMATVSRNNIDKMCSNSAILKSASRRAHAAALANLDNLFAHAVERERHQDRNEDTNIDAIGRYYAPIEVDGQKLEAKLTVKYINHPAATRIYSVEALEITRPAGQLVDADIAKSDRLHTPIAGLATKTIQPSGNKANTMLRLVRNTGC